MDTLLFLAAPFTACLILVVTLSYFGNHILSRGVIFVDIAVAQVAALGTMIGILLGVAEGTVASSLLSLGFTLIIVSIFAISKFRHRELSSEVIIGIIYCLALALAYLLVDAVPGGSNFVQKTFTGAILWVTWGDIARTALIFFVIGVIHLAVHRRIIAVSEESDKVSTASRRFYDLLFYITFGIVVVEAVKIGGIFLVFMVLIAPAAIAQFFTQSWGRRFVISWVSGLFGSLIGIYISYRYNFPNGPTIVCTLGIMLIAVALLTRRRRLEA